MDIKVHGTMTVGVRGFFCGRKGNFLESISNDIGVDNIIQHLRNSKYEYTSLYPGRVIVKKQRVVGYNGRRKFFYIINGATGVLVFDSFYKNEDRFTKKQIDYYIRAARILENLGCFPKIHKECSVSIKCHVRKRYSQRSSIDFAINKKARGIILDRIYTPFYFLQTQGKHASLFRKAWKYKRKRLFDWPRSKLKMMFGENFCMEHPDFNKRCFHTFCKKMDEICQTHRKVFKTIQHQRHPNTKYGNVIYNLKDKKWYFVDLEANI